MFEATRALLMERKRAKSKIRATVFSGIFSGFHAIFAEIHLYGVKTAGTLDRILICKLFPTQPTAFHHHLLDLNHSALFSYFLPY
jgi:hypothetical protein